MSETDEQRAAELSQAIDHQFSNHEKEFPDLWLRIYDIGFKGITHIFLRQALAERAVVRAFQTIWTCKILDQRRAMQREFPHYLKVVSLVEPGFCEALDLQVGADNRPLLKAAKKSNSAFALAQMKNATDCLGTEEGYKETVALRLQQDLVEDVEFAEKVGRSLSPRKPFPVKLSFGSNSELILYYWLPLRIWAKTSDEARFDVIEAGKLMGHTVPGEASFRQSLTDTKRRVLKSL